MYGLFLAAAILAGVLIWGLLIWLVVYGVFGVLSGWKDLARRYPAPQAIETWHWFGQTVKVGAVRYRRSMRVAALPDGLYLAVSGLLRNPPVRIPWQEMTGATPSSVYGHPCVAVTVGTPRVATVEFRAELYNAIYAAAAHYAANAAAAAAAQAAARAEDAGADTPDNTAQHNTNAHV